MNKPSATTTGRTAMQLAAALTPQQQQQLEQFAAHRLRQAAVTPARQRALAQFCPQSLVHAALEKFARGDAGWPGGRHLSPAQRSSPAAFLAALQSAMNSLICDACRRAEARQEHLPVATGGAEPHAVEPGTGDLDELLTLQDIEAVLFGKLTAEVGDDPESLAAVDGLWANCQTGHYSSDHGVHPKTMHAVRRRAQQLWRELNP